ncbi:MAG: methylated-DNA--[protein]-cysteine S-methyltransferase [Nitrososphaerota archaeon]|nr:methylated-DNA--[protein]-cysteine S-methyltransferase [Nitrososphaerota archaeon]
MTVYYALYSVDFFAVGFAGDGKRIVRVGFYESEEEFVREMEQLFKEVEMDEGVFSGFLRDLERYFSGEQISFNHPIHLTGTNFQIRVWEKVREIPYGETRSYGWVAESIGRAGAARAVANAVKRNPIALIIPCHRVVRSDGDVAGSGFGKRVREYLLQLEGAIP